MYARSLMNMFPWSSLVKKSAIISSVGQYLTLRLPFAMWLVMKKYHALRCLVQQELDRRPFFSSRMALWLS